MSDFKLGTNPQPIQRQIASVDAQIDRLIARRALLETMPEDDFEIGSVVTFEKHFSRQPVRTYNYAAIKAPGGWYTTGPHNPGPFSWDKLLAWLDATGDLESLCWAPYVEPLIG